MNSSSITIQDVLKPDLVQHDAAINREHMYILISYSAALVSFVCALVAIHLLMSRARFRRPQLLLAIFFALFATQLALTAIQLATPSVLFGPLKVILVLLLLPIAYLFCQALARPRLAWLVGRDSMHLLPVVAGLGVLAFGWVHLVDILIIVTEGAYAMLLLRLLSSGPSAIELPRRFQKIAFRWGQCFLIYYAFLLIADIAIAVQTSDGRATGQSSAFAISMAGLFIAGAFVGLSAMGKDSIFAWLGEGGLHKSSGPQTLANIESQAFGQAITLAIAAPENYGDEDLTIKKFARRMGVPVRKISEVVNRDLQCSFSELVSQARINAAKEILASPEGRSKKIVDVALCVGFGSKSNFNKEFKKIANCTPSEYRELTDANQVGHGVGPHQT